MDADRRKQYGLTKCIYWVVGFGNKPGYIIEGPDEAFYPNLWLHRLSPNTARQYGYKLCVWLNHCLKHNMHYDIADEKTLNNFLLGLRFQEDGGIFNISESNRCHSTIREYINVITSFYTFIENVRDDIQMPMKEVSALSKYSYLKNIVWDKTKKKLLVDDYIERYKPKKKYVKWYSEEQIDAIESNFTTYRDKAMFRIELDGARFDEGASVRICDYNIREAYLIAYRSKGKETGETGRAVPLSKESVKMLENYLTYEREPVEDALLKKGKFASDKIFINLRSGGNQGKPIKYQNYRKILKGAAARAGVDSDLIRTHSGRSTSVMKDILFHAQHPDLLSIEDIRIKYGWSNISSITPYLDTSNPLIIIENRKILDKVRNEIKQKYDIDGKIKDEYKPPIG